MNKILYDVQIQDADVPTHRGNIYPLSVLQKIAAGFPVYGSIGVNRTMRRTDPEHISHLVKKLRIEGNYLVGDVEIFPMPKGEILMRFAEHACFCLKGIITYESMRERIVKDINVLSIDAIRKRNHHIHTKGKYHDHVFISR